MGRPYFVDFELPRVDVSHVGIENLLAGFAESHHQPHDRATIDVEGSFHGSSAVALALNIEAEGLFYVSRDGQPWRSHPISGHQKNQMTQSVLRFMRAYSSVG